MDASERTARGDESAVPASADDAVDEQLKERAMDEAPVGITIADAQAPDVPLIYINDAFERLTGYPREEVLGRNCRFLQGPETDPEPVVELREAIEQERRTVVELRNYRRDGELFWNRVELAPVTNESGETTHFVGFQLDITDRKRAEQTVRDERAALSRLVDRINGLLEGVTTELIRATSVPDLHRRVPRRVVEADPYTVAWIGEADLRTNAVVPDEDSFAADNDATTHPDLSSVIDRTAIQEGITEGPIADALRTGTIQVSQDAASIADHAAFAAVPLTYRDVTDAVLVIYADDTDVFDEQERAVLASLGRAVAAARNALESRRILTVEPEVELEVVIEDPSLWLSSLAAELDTTIEYVGTMQREDGADVLTLAIEGMSAARVREAENYVDGIASLSLVADREDGVIVDATPRQESLVTALAAIGARTESLTADADGVRVTCLLPAETDTRDVMESLRSRYERVALRSKHERTSSGAEPERFTERVRDRLTDRQATALHRAYVSGYFERPRQVDGDQLAESMGITRSTFHQHLAAAQQKLLRAFFEEAPGREERNSASD